MRKRPEVITSTILITIAAALLFAGLAAVVALVAGSPLGWMSAPVQASHNGGSVALYALDMDPTTAPANTIDAAVANTEMATLGTIETCISVTHPATVNVDVVVQGWPSGLGDRLVAYTAAVGYPAGLSLAVVRSGSDLTAGNQTLLTADPQSGPMFAALLEAGGAGPNTWDVSIADFSAQDLGDESIDGEEDIDGFVARVAFTTTAAGPALLPITLGGAPADDAGNMTLDVPPQGGTIAVDQPCQNPPVADDKPTESTTEDTPVVITLSGSDVETCELTFNAPSNLVNGGVGAITDNACVAGSPNTDSATVTFTPDANVCGTDAGSFTYTVTDGGQGTSPAATVTIDITCENDAPVAADVPLGDVLKNSFADGWQPQVSDVDTGDTLTCSIASQPTNGSATVPSDCSTGSYTPNANYLGPDSFTYSVSDGTDSNTATVTLNVAAQLPTPTAVVSPTATATATASPTASPTATATSLPGTGSPDESGDGGGGLTYLVIGLASLAVAGGALTVAAMLRRKAIRNRQAG